MLAIAVIATLVTLQRATAGEWATVAMPSRSVFLGLDPPRDPERWGRARALAASGEQVLLRRVLETVRNPMDFIQGKISFKDIHQLADSTVSKAAGGLSKVQAQTSQRRAPVTLFGFRTFSAGRFEGKEKSFNGFHPEAIGEYAGKLPRKMVVIGSMDENWGYLSTAYPNRTASWGIGHGPKKNNKLYSADHDRFLRNILDDPNLLLLLSNQHFNISHPKVLSYPLGMTDPKLSWDVGHRVLRRGVKKESSQYLVFSAGSDWGPRPLIRKCVERLLGPAIESHGKMKGQPNPFTPASFKVKISTSIAVLAMAGFGFDTYRLWETLALGSIPILEHGFGFERTLWKLPALFVDDYSELTSDIIRLAYVEALYRVDEWDYTRLTRKHWQDLVFQTSVTESLDYVMERHPMSAVDANFTRPYQYFSCDKMGGCGPGTKRTPHSVCIETPY